MKRISIVLLLLLYRVFVHGQGGQHKVSFPGFIQINDSVLISKYEVTIRQYSYFLAIMNKESGDINFIQKALPNPNYTNWTLWNSYSKQLTSYDSIYDRSKDTVVSFVAWIGDWPIVNVTKAQAKMYCSFKTMQYHLFYKNSKAKAQKKLPEDIYFRLPTAEEWLLAANVINKQKLPVCKDLYDFDTTGQSHPMEIGYGLPNQLGIYNILGNVAEIIEDSELVFGGSYLDAKENCQLNSTKPFTRDNSVGFRIVAIIRQIEND